MQKFLNAIAKYMKDNFNVLVWGHLDDLIAAHTDRKLLQRVSNQMVYLFKLLKWDLNLKKTQLRPVSLINFLGATWSRDRVVRSEKATDTMDMLWYHLRDMKNKLEGKPLIPTHSCFFKLLHIICRQFFLNS